MGNNRTAPFILKRLVFIIIAAQTLLVTNGTEERASRSVHYKTILINMIKSLAIVCERDLKTGRSRSGREMELVFSWEIFSGSGIFGEMLLGFEFLFQGVGGTMLCSSVGPGH